MPTTYQHELVNTSRLLGPWDVTQVKPAVPWEVELGDSS